MDPTYHEGAICMAMADNYKRKTDWSDPSGALGHTPMRAVLESVKGPTRQEVSSATRLVQLANITYTWAGEIL